MGAVSAQSCKGCLRWKGSCGLFSRAVLELDRRAFSLEGILSYDGLWDHGAGVFLGPLDKQDMQPRHARY